MRRSGIKQKGDITEVTVTVSLVKQILNFHWQPLSKDALPAKQEL